VPWTPLGYEVRDRKLIIHKADAEQVRFIFKRFTAAYMLAPNEYQAEVEREAMARPGLVFDLRDRSGFARHGSL
jgi:hypothetical protein